MSTLMSVRLQHRVIKIADLPLPRGIKCQLLLSRGWDFVLTSPLQDGTVSVSVSVSGSCARCHNCREFIGMAALLCYPLPLPLTVVPFPLPRGSLNLVGGQCLHTGLISASAASRNDELLLSVASLI